MNDKKADELVQWAKAADVEENRWYVASDPHIEQAAGDLYSDMYEAGFLSGNSTSDAGFDELHQLIEWRIRQAITHRQRFGIEPDPIILCSCSDFLACEHPWPMIYRAASSLSYAPKPDNQKE